MIRILTATLVCALFGVLAFGAGNDPFTADARQTYALIKPSLLRAAEKMPEEYYSFRTVPEVRTFGEMIAHVADGQLRMCAVVKGETVSASASSKKSKTDLVAALKASFDYCDPGIRLDDRCRRGREGAMGPLGHDQARPAQLEHLARQ